MMFRWRSPNSFTAGSLVLLADGTSRPIEDVRVGDRVVSSDPVTGTTDAELVTDTITGTGDKQLVDVTIDTDGHAGTATATVTATENHPFWVPDLAEWADAGTLQVGQWLRNHVGAGPQPEQPRR
jgi:Pretoxin HINT domain